MRCSYAIQLQNLDCIEFHHWHPRKCVIKLQLLLLELFMITILIFIWPVFTGFWLVPLSSTKSHFYCYYIFNMLTCNHNQLHLQSNLPNTSSLVVVWDFAYRGNRSLWIVLERVSCCFKEEVKNETLLILLVLCLCALVYTDSYSFRPLTVYTIPKETKRGLE